MTQQAVVKKDTGAITLKDLVAAPAYAARFREILKDRAPQFVASLIQASQQSGLRDADPHSIVASSMTAAALDLPIDKTLGFAYLVPFKNNGKKQCQCQIGYRGFIQLALRSGHYAGMNACTINAEAYKGRNEIGDPVIDWEKVDETQPAVGYFFGWKTIFGFIKSIYWTREKVEAHARRYSQAYRSGYDSPWKTDFDAMGLKTVIKFGLSHWGIMSIELRRALQEDQSVRADVDANIEFPDNDAPDAPAKPKRANATTTTVEVDSTVVTDPPEQGDDAPPMEGATPLAETKPEPEKEKVVEKVVEKPAEKAPEKVAVKSTPQAEVTDPVAFLQNRCKDLDVAEEKFCAWASTKWRFSPCENIIELWEIAPGRVKAIAKEFETFAPEIRKAA